MFVVPLHLPEVSPVREEPSPWKDVAVTVPATSSLVLGLVFPIPTFPEFRIVAASVAPLLPTRKCISAPVAPIPEVV